MHCHDAPAFSRWYAYLAARRANYGSAMTRSYLLELLQDSYSGPFPRRYSHRTASMHFRKFAPSCCLLSATIFLRQQCHFRSNISKSAHSSQARMRLSPTAHNTSRLAPCAALAELTVSGQECYNARQSVGTGFWARKPNAVPKYQAKQTLNLVAVCR
jgi:hypothetical protein